MMVFSQAIPFVMNSALSFENLRCLFGIFLCLAPLLPSSYGNSLIDLIHFDLHSLLALSPIVLSLVELFRGDRDAKVSEEAEGQCVGVHAEVIHYLLRLER